MLNGKQSVTYRLAIIQAKRTTKRATQTIKQAKWSIKQAKRMIK